MSAGLLILGVALLLALLTIRRERAKWNGGICAETGEPWIPFDTDSAGARGYYSGWHTLWVSWGADREPPK